MKYTIFQRQLRIEGCLFNITIDRNFSTALVPTPTQMHNHANWELHFVREGLLTYRIGGDDVVITPGHVCIIRPNTYHSSDGAGAHTGYRLRLSMDGCSAAALYAALPWSGGFCMLDASERVFRLLERIRGEFTAMSWGKEQRLDACLTLLITDLWGRQLAAGTTCLPKFTPDEDEYGVQIDAFFALHYKEDITLADLAAALFVSPRQASRILSHNYGMTFKNKLAELRVNDARELLAAGTASVTEIAQQLGYGNVRYFTRMFRARTGLSPSEFRRSCKSGAGETN